MTQLNLLDLIEQPEHRGGDDVDHLVDAILAELEAHGLSKADQQALAVRLNAHQVLSMVRRWPAPARNYFLSLIVEGLTDDVP
ncbi:MAG: hypothetical protein ACHWZW_22355 [Spirulina sp.]